MAVAEKKVTREQRRLADMMAKDLHATEVRAFPKTSRNAPCPCGSGKKFKHCCYTNGRQVNYIAKR